MTAVQQLALDALERDRLLEAADADLIATVTPARAPILRSEWVKPGTHINAIGADAPGKQELFTELTVKARVFVDSVEQASHSGEINMPWRQGLLDEKKLAGTIGQVIAGTVPGRKGDEITVFDSTGLSIQDMAVAHMVYERATKSLPNGVASNFQAGDPYPVYLERGQGSRVWDVDGSEYVDFHAAFGPIILGHADDRIRERVMETARELDVVGAGSVELEIQLAEKIREHVPSAEKVLFSNSGSEATYHVVVPALMATV